MKKISYTFLIIILLSSCVSGRNGAFKEDIGAIAGAVGGAWIGSNIGRGNGNIVAIATGTMLGAVLGQSVGASLDGGDIARYHHTSQVALETGANRTSLVWNNPNSGNSGDVTPLNVYKSGKGDYCREYTQTVVVGGEKEEGYGIACRDADGKWRIEK